MSVLNNSNAISTGVTAYNLESSLRFRSSASAYLNRTPTTAGNRKTWTWSGWVKRGELSATNLYQLFSARNTTTTPYTLFYFDNDEIRFLDSLGGSLISNSLYRDVSAWYHLICAVDTTQATSSNRVKIYVNGEQITSFSTATYPSLNADLTVNSTYAHAIGAQPYSTQHFDGYMTEVNFVDGQALTADDFGEYDTITGVWKPKEYTGTYGTNGFYLPMKETQQATGFNTVLYTGNGGTQDITGVGFSPDLVWLKARNTTTNHILSNTITGTYKYLSSNTTSAEATDINGDGISAFNADGFSVAYTDGGAWNNPSNNYVAWCWDAGSSTVSNTDGTITSSVRANPATGFSIVTYTGNGTNGATIGHGLGSAPDMIIVKNRDVSSASNWSVYHSSANSTAPEDYALLLNSTSSAVNTNLQWNDTAPTSSVFTVGTENDVNNSGSKHIAYCFSEVAGYSKFGSYTGTGATGNTITTGFRPAFVMIKRTDSIGNWIMIDNTRSVNNPKSQWLNANTSDAEGTSSASDIDFDDNGFTLQNTNADRNGSGNSYIYMAFADTRDAQFNFDASGNKNNWTANNINSNASSETTYDIMNDVPTLTDEDTANFYTFGGLQYRPYGTLSDGNLNLSTNTTNYGTQLFGDTPLPTTGKWYLEVTKITAYGAYGITEPTTSVNLRTTANTTDTPGTYGIAIDIDAGKGWIGKSLNNSDIESGLNPDVTFTPGLEFYPVQRDAYSAQSANGCFNFGQRPFAYTPPTGYKKLNTYNLPDSTIKDGSQYMNPVLYTGDGTSSHAITGVGFSPDLVWIKHRSLARNHILSDSVRGVNKRLFSNLTNAEVENTPNDGLLSYDSDGFSIGSNANVNENNQSFVAWNWRASDSSAVSNTDGTITSTVSANPTSGFSVVTYTGNATTGATVGHGLGVKPAMVIVKNRSTTTSWEVWHQDLGSESYFIRLNDTAATYTAFTDRWTAFSNSVITLGNSSATNGSGNNLVAYCFAEVEGFSKFGSYTGNGSADGPFIYTGFRPAFVFYKNSSSAAAFWRIFDTSRGLVNQVNNALYPNSSIAEDTGSGPIDILSNGFKIRTSQANDNGSGNTIIYMAFAENPFKQSLAR